MCAQILIIDDNPGISKAIKRACRHSSHKLFFCNAGRDALSMMDVLKFDIIFSDQYMPEMSGLHFLKHARCRQPNAQRIMFSEHDKNDTFNTSIDPELIHTFLNKSALYHDFDQLASNLSDEHNTFQPTLPPAAILKIPMQMRQAL